MPDLGDLKNCKTIIYDADKKTTIAEAEILDYNRTENVISIDTTYIDNRESMRVSLLIIGKKGIFESMGIVRRKTMMRLREIALFGAKEKESRGATRYTVHAPAVIEEIYRDGIPIRRTPPLTVMVVNLSSSGILLETASNEFDENSAFMLNLKIAGRDTVINTIVVRRTPGEGGTWRLGCSFVSIVS